MSLFSWVIFVVFLFLGGLGFWSSTNLTFVGKLDLLGFSLDGLEFFFILDSITLLFSLMLIVCGSVALSYCCHYFGGLEVASGLFYLMLVFLFVMGALVWSGNSLVTLIFWEYLGLVSFLLILFYSNSVSLRASVVTLVSSRFGDVALFVLFGWLLYSLDTTASFICVLLSFVVVTKSACYPLVSWLIEAMRAPTPVSSLVHSSTLVAAGVWFLLRYNSVFSELAVWLVFVSCLATIMISGLCAAFFKDIKKIVAFSTCNNVSWCLLFFICGDVLLSSFQLLSHGVSKCYLFMLVGDLMSSSDGSQDWNSIYSSLASDYSGSLFRCFLVMCLTGFPFIGVFFSKHFMFNGSIYHSSLLFSVLLLLGFFLTFVYSGRFVCLLVGDSFGSVVGSFSGFTFVFSLLLLSSLFNCIISGTLEETFVVGFFLNVLLLCTQIGGLISGLILYSSGGSNILCESSRLVGGCDSYVGALYNIYNSFRWFIGLSNFRWETVVLRYTLYQDYYFLGKVYGGSAGVGWLISSFFLVGVVYSWFY